MNSALGLQVSPKACDAGISTRGGQSHDVLIEPRYEVHLCICCPEIQLQRCWWTCRATVNMTVN